MPVIAIIGANGKVGTEVCLFLSQMKGVKVKPVSRTELGSSFLRRCGIECWHGSLESISDAERLLSDCDLVADFSLVKGKAFEIRKAISVITENAIRYSPRKAHYVYISTIMAFGMSARDDTFRKRSLSGSVYGATKRYGERLARKLGKKMGKEVYILRLGQVHGELQEISRNILSGLKDEVTYIPSDPSWTVFAFSIAEAIVNIANGKERPGLYTMVSVPPWDWKDVHMFYCQQKNINPTIVYEKPFEQQKWHKEIKRRLHQWIISTLIRRLNPYRETITGYLLYIIPKVELKASALYSLSNANSQISKFRSNEKYRPYGQTYRGYVPGKRLSSLSDSRITMVEPLKKVRSIIRNIVHNENNK